MKVFCIFCMLLFGCHVIYGQEIIFKNQQTHYSVAELLELFTLQHNLQFSYDASRMKKSYVTILHKTLSFDELKLKLSRLLITLEKDNYDNILLVQSKQIKEQCLILIDMNSGFPVANVLIFNDDKFLATTDVTGTVKIKEQPGTLLTLKHIKYATSKQPLEVSNSCLKIYLKANVLSLDEIVLTNYVAKGIVKNKNSSLTLSPKALSLLPGLTEPDVFQSLQLVPGVNSPEEDPAALHIRGGTPDQNLVLWDGIKLYQNSHFFNQITSFNPYITKKAEVYRSGTSVRHGDRIAGVIDIHSDDDLFDTFKAGGGLNMLAVAAYFKIPLHEKWGLLIAGRRSYTDLIKTFTFNSLSSKVFQNSRFLSTDETSIEQPSLNYKFSDANLKLMFKPNENHTYSLSMINIANGLTNSSNNKLMKNGFDLQDDLTQNNFGASFTWKRSKEGFTTKQFQTFGSSYTSIYDFNYRDSADVSLQTGRINKVLEGGFDLHYDIPIKTAHNLLLGTQITYTNVKEFVSDTYSVNNEVILKNAGDASFFGRSSIGAYTAYRYNKNSWFLSAGLRAEMLTTLGFLFEPRLFASLYITDGLQITTSIERRNQSFSQINRAQIEPPEYNILPAANTFWAVQTSNGATFNRLFFQKSNQATLGLLYQEGGWTAEVEGYYKKIEETLPQNDPFLTSLYSFYSFRETKPGDANRIGIDALLRKRINNYNIWLSYTLAKNTVRYAELQGLAFPERFDQRHRLNLSQTFTINRFEFGLGWTYGSGLPYTQITSGSISEINALRATNQLYAKRLPAFHRLDSSLLYHFENKGRWNATVGFSLRNIYNRRKRLRDRYTLGIDADGEEFIKSIEDQSLKITGDLVFRLAF